MVWDLRRAFGVGCGVRGGGGGCVWRGMACGVWYERLGFWVLGRGEWAGCDGPELVGVWADLDVPDETLFHERLPRASWFRGWGLGLRC